MLLVAAGLLCGSAVVLHHAAGLLSWWIRVGGLSYALEHIYVVAHLDEEAGEVQLGVLQGLDQFTADFKSPVESEPPKGGWVVLSDVHRLHHPGPHPVTNDDAIDVGVVASDTRPIIFPHVRRQVCRSRISFCAQVANLKVRNLERE